ncbi:hypothetical protein [Methanobrevibacter intestini]|uniref:hypothetical protein n=1 Tax=Methanobrevibacter intestini TaxID=2911853 RepID=UPI003CFC13E2
MYSLERQKNLLESYNLKTIKYLAKKFGINPNNNREFLLSLTDLEMSIEDYVKLLFGDELNKLQDDIESHFVKVLN